MYISAKQIKALTILRDNPNITANRITEKGQKELKEHEELLSTLKL